MKTMVVNGSVWQCLYSHNNTHALIRKRPDGNANEGIIYNSLTGKIEKWFDKRYGV